MATKSTHTTMQNTAAIPAARHTDPVGSRRRQRGSQRCRGEQRGEKPSDRHWLDHHDWWS
jgi:hypothetical protein